MSVPPTFKNKPPEIDTDGMTVEQLQAEIDEEYGNWQRTGIDPSKVPHNIFTMDSQLMTVIQIIKEKHPEITEDEFALRYGKILLEKLRSIRHNSTRAAITHGVPGVRGI